MQPATATATPSAAAQALWPTPALLLGPYYPLQPVSDASAVLWRGGRLPAGARMLRLNGRVQSLGGVAVPAADVELWHADPAGRYRHPSAPEQSQVLDGFTGYGRTRTGDDGSFVFDTLLPAGYEDGNVRRTPHLHLQITGRFDRLVTQLFLAGHADNDRDHWYRALRSPNALTATLRADREDRLDIEWTAVLRRG